MTPNPDFKVTSLFDTEYLRNDTRYRHSYNAVAGAITVHVSAKPKDISDGRKITAVASQRHCDIA